ncbi:MAG TPA: methylenetetrahydrofolate reductase [NAD(P)H] [Anaeromyxobacteraceae bacterium]|nr:methylenetetrahydrofolate reductase [NAD(P)H] [Anaeromyxobacteraceae bacterium]
MRITEILAAARAGGQPVFTFEFFPPKTEEGERALMETVAALRPLKPAWVSVTYGAGGSTRAKTVELVGRLKRESGIEPMAHVTCVGASRDEVAALLDEVAAAGVENVLALRGDPPRGEARFQPHPGGFRFASELVAFIRSEPRRWPFCVGAAAYPEGHPETPDLAADLRHLKAKVEAGTDFLVTQLFFDNARFDDFVARARAAGIAVPIMPGIMPITNVEGMERFGATIPPRLQEALRALKGNADGARELGVAYASLQCQDLLRAGVPGVHFYTLNRSPSTRAIVAALLASEPWVTPGAR